MELAKLVWRVIKMARERRVYIGSEKPFGAWHIEGKKNIRADDQSRKDVGVEEWKICRSLYQAFSRMWGPFSLDAFAAAWNNQCSRYICRQRWDHQAVGHGALAFPLEQEQGVVWAHPPPHRRAVVTFLQRARAAKRMEVVLVLPLVTSGYLAEALSLSVDVPVVLPCCERGFRGRQSLLARPGSAHARAA